ncbi:hypothetical protein ACO0LB_03965 [Undibacterium sp. SXout7W]|uniref:hypothetical protein n=1 Tax=Undibacterium sp. SXout7W TaxID=3413049 RepID=UPI003BF1F0AF
MDSLRLLSALLIFSFWPSYAAAEYTGKYQRALAATSSNFPHLNFIWANAEGDLNGDGIPDVAMLLTGNRAENDPREERLVVLTGNPDGSYKVLSISAEFCHPSKFYNLEIVKNSLFAQMVEYADSSRISSYTLQFRYNAKINDLELIGEEMNSESYETDSIERTSTNYLTGTVIHTTKTGTKGKTKTRTEQIGRSVSPAKLNGYLCGG